MTRMPWLSQEEALRIQIPASEIAIGSLYRICARNGSFGVARISEAGEIYFDLCRLKFGSEFLDTETYWYETHGTAIPLEKMGSIRVPGDTSELWAFLKGLEGRN